MLSADTTLLVELKKKQHVFLLCKTRNVSIYSVDNTHCIRPHSLPQTGMTNRLVGTNYICRLVYRLAMDFSNVGHDKQCLIDHPVGLDRIGPYGLECISRAINSSRHKGHLFVVS